MQDYQWVPWVIGIVGGGAAGAIITALVTNHRNRVQPIGYKSEKIEIFKKDQTLSLLQAKIILTDNVTTHDIANLVIVRLTLINKGNQDISEFEFGMTLVTGDAAIKVQAETPDRHHIAEQLKEVTFDSPTSEIDYSLKPFNRGDIYIFNLFITVSSDNETEREIKLSSKHSIRFTPLETDIKLIPLGKDVVPVFVPIRKISY